MRAKDIMTRSIISVSPDHSVQHAARLMRDNNVSGLPVLDDDARLLGIMTEGDLLRRSELGAGLKPVNVGQPSQTGSPDPETYVKTHSWRVGDVMSAEVVTVDEDASLREVASLMMAHDIKRIPVLRGGSLVGIVSRADLLKVFEAALPDQPLQGDQAIRRAVLARLESDLGLSPAEIDVSVTDRNVVLSGAVRSEALRRAACLAAEGISGIDGVINNLRIDAKTGDAKPNSS